MNEVTHTISAVVPKLLDFKESTKFSPIHFCFIHVYRPAALIRTTVNNIKFNVK